MKKLLFFLLTITFFACAERKTDPREAIIWEFLDNLKNEKVSPKLLQSEYFVESQSWGKATVEAYLQTLGQIKELMAKSREIKVMTYAEARSRAEDIPFVDDPQIDNLFVIKMNDRYIFCLMNGDKIKSLQVLLKLI